MKNIIFLILLCSVLGCASAQIAIKENTSFSKYKKIYLYEFDDDPRHVLLKVRSRLEKIGFEVIMIPEGETVGGNQGTGFILTTDGYVLTSGHVIDKKKEATIWLDGKRYEAELIHIEKPDNEDNEKTKELKKSKNVQDVMKASLNSKDNRSIYEEITEKDFALLKIKSPDQSFTPITIAKDTQYRMGQEVYTIGFPLSNILGDKPRLTKGLISSTVGMKDNPNFVQISTEIQPGNSGGPLLNEKGQLVGMVQMTLNPLNVLNQTGSNLPQNVNFAVKNEAIKKFLNDTSKKAKFSLRDGDTTSFEEVQNSIVQIRSGIIPEDFKEQAKLVCLVSYSSFWDMWYRFRILDVVFYDLDTEQLLLRAGQYGDNPFSSEDKTLDKTFEEIQKKVGR